MKHNLLATVLLLVAIIHNIQAQFGSFASAIQLSKDGGITKDFYNTTKLVGDVNAIGPYDFAAALGSFSQNSGKLLITGGELKTFRGTNDNVCGAKLYYRVYPAGSPAGSFSLVNLPFFANCNAGVFADGKGPCTPTDQKWQTVASTIDLSTAGAPGNYTLELYFEVNGKVNSSTECSETTYDSNNGNNFKADFTIAPALPVRLVDFKATNRQGKPFLTWSTLSEENFSRFNIERSVDGIHFKNIATLSAKGNSTTRINYQYLDHTAPANILFYRLNQIDNDGSFAYSNILKVNAPVNSSMELLPNPATHQLFIRGCNAGDRVNISDVTGRMLSTQIATGINVTLLVQHLKPGKYFVSIHSPTGESSLSFVKD